MAVAILTASCSDASTDGAAVVAAPSSAAPPDNAVTPESTVPPEATTTTDAATSSSLITVPTDPEPPSPPFAFDGVRAIDDPLNESFDPPLIDLRLVVLGGPPPDGIPPIDAPNFFGVEQAGFLRPTEPIVALELGDEVVGFPIQIMTWHEIVNTEIDGVPVSVTFCPLCNSATAFVRQLNDGRIIDFGTSGWLFNSSLLMYDRQTGSIWTHFDGTAVHGALVGETLERIPLQTVSWESFRTTFPDAQVLNRATGFVKNYGMNPYAGYDSTTTSPFAFVGDTDDRLLAKTRVVAIRGDETLAVVTESLAKAGVVEAELDGERIVVFHQAGTSSALDSQIIHEGKDVGATGVFRAAIDGQELTFSAGEDGFVDAETGTTWDLFGRAIDGPNRGAELDAIEHLDTFWFAIAAFTPDARIIA